MTQAKVKTYQVGTEEELKNKIASDFFASYDWTRILGRVDFAIYPKVSQKMVGLEITPFLWAEAKRDPSDLMAAITQLILTIGKERTFDKHLPPYYLGAFDCEKIAFVPYNEVHHFFYMNDFNWNVRPSDHNTREFKMVYDQVKQIVIARSLVFIYEIHEQELGEFIKNNFRLNHTIGSKIQIDRNNFVIIYQKWLKEVKPTIGIDWDAAKQAGIIDGDFYLADLLSRDDKTILDNLPVVLNIDHYELDRRMNKYGLIESKKAIFNDKQKKYKQFWSRYERPPKEEYFDYILQRRDLLVPQDVRERKGSFFTPQIWVELSQEYLARAFGENWQDEYYIWDCAAGTGNLLNGLVDKYRIFASTLDQQDVDTMHQRIENGANLLKEHVFQFDFLNDEWLPKSKGGKMPDVLYDIVTDPEKRKKLIIYINPPYAEAGNMKTISGTGKHKAGVSNNSWAYKTFQPLIGKAVRELFALFMMQIYTRCPNSKLAIFCTPKFIQATSFQKFRSIFLARYKDGFVVPAYTFDNVMGHFPISFTIWDFETKEKINIVNCDVYNEKGELIGSKNFFNGNHISINQWINSYNKSCNIVYSYLMDKGPDFTQQDLTFITQNPNFTPRAIICDYNIIPVCVYFAVRHCIKDNWLNHTDQFMKPNDLWKDDLNFHADSVIFTLFHGKNRISCKEGINHWIPFPEKEVNARAKYRSDFMVRFLNGDWGPSTLFPVKPFRILDYLSLEAQRVYDIAREIWRYYHAQPNSNPDASLYDIKEYFKGRTEDGRMKQKSDDSTFNNLMEQLKEAMDVLALRIAEKAYEYGFLKR